MLDSTKGKVEFVWTVDSSCTSCSVSFEIQSLVINANFDATLGGHFWLWILEERRILLSRIKPSTFIHSQKHPKNCETALTVLTSLLSLTNLSILSNLSTLLQKNQICSFFVFNLEKFTPNRNFYMWCPWQISGIWHCYIYEICHICEIFKMCEICKQIHLGHQKIIKSSKKGEALLIICDRSREGATIAGSDRGCQSARRVRSWSPPPENGQHLRLLQSAIARGQGQTSKSGLPPRKVIWIIARKGEDS